MTIRTFANLAFLAMLPGAVFAQTAPVAAQPAAVTTAAATTVPADSPKYEIADIHKSPPLNNPVFNGGFLGGGRYFLRQATLADLITTAYSLRNSDYVQGGPPWLDWYRFDIEAKVPAGTTQEKARLMLQDLLANRFKLVTHPGNAMVPAFLMTAVNGKPNVKASGPTDSGSCQRQNQPGSESGPSLTITLVCRGATFSSLADALNADGGGGYLSYPVIDTTSLNGPYDFDLKWTPKYSLTRVGPSAANIFQALVQQLGLKIEFKTTPRPGLVVDSVNDAPTPNSPDLAHIMPPLPPPQFEVATIRPTDSDAQRGFGKVSGDEVSVQGIPLKFLITLAWGLDPRDETVLVAPKWLDSDRVDIHAKIAVSDLGVNSQGKPGSMDFETIRPMLRSLLIERFQIKFHMEDRPANAFTLIAVHPRLDKADAAERTSCKDGPGRDGKDPRMTNVILNSLVTCRNMTMDEFSAYLTNRRGAVGYLFYPVKNATGLEGAWDFTVSWSSADLTQNAAPGPGAPAQENTPVASDPNGAISYFEALEKEHGLKLVKEKRVEPVLVIDSINPHPTEN